MDMTCLITGATSGVGEAIATRLAGHGADVLVVARPGPSGGAAAMRIRHRVPGSRVEVLAADLADLAQVRALAEEVRRRRDRLDVLVLNAGVARPRRELTTDGMEVDFVTNHLSGFLLTEQLGELLRGSAPARVITTTSEAHRHVRELDWDAMVTGENFHHMRSYSTTKLLNVLFTTELAGRLTGTGVTANAADPGFARTALGRDAPAPFRAFLTLARPFRSSPTRAADTAVRLALDPDLAGVTGRYFSNSRPVDPSDLAADPGAAERLRELSTDLLTREATR